jgi:hypothetical protein
MVIAGIRAEKPQITESELRQELFLRYYGDEFSPEQRKKILAAIAVKSLERKRLVTSD